MNDRPLIQRMCRIAAPVAGTLAAGVLGHRVGLRRRDRRVARLLRGLEAPPSRFEPLRPAVPLEIPIEVRALASRLLPAERPHAKRVRLYQRGAMRMSEGASPLSFTAEHQIAVGHPAFVWLANLRLPFGARLRVIDSYLDGEGRLEARLMGSIPVAQAQGAAVSHGELMRYLAEIVWCPEAILDNPALTWRVLDDRRLEVASGEGDGRAAVELRLDAAGDVSSIHGLRPRRVGTRNVLTSWTGRFTDYREMAGCRIPVRGEVDWDLPSGPFTYWRAEIVDLAHDPPLEPEGREDSPGWRLFA